MPTNEGLKVRTNFYVGITGVLQHDNHLFDLSCPTCHGMFSSFKRQTCPKCNAALTHITIKSGRAMCISEGTIKPLLPDQQWAEDLAQTTKRKDAVLPVYRFKMFSFSDPTGAIAPPEAHSNCKKGAIVEIKMINHQPIAKFFVGEKKGNQVELLFFIFAAKGDSVTILKAAEIANATVPHRVDKVTGVALPMQQPKVDTAESLMAETEVLKAKMAAFFKAHTPVVSPIVDAPKPKETIVEFEDTEECPFPTELDTSSAVDPMAGYASL